MRRPRIAQPAPRDYTSEIDLLGHHLAALTGRWHGVVPPPPSLAEAVEELTTTLEELHAMNEDLTQSQQDALDTQRRYRELFEGVPEAYFVTDLHSFIQEANRAAAQLLHIERSLLVGFPLASFVAQEMRTFFQTQLAWLRNGAEIHEWVMRVQPLHQPPVPVVCHVAPARDADEALVGLRWLLRDLTAQQQAQETLAQHVRELTAKLDHANLHMRELHHRMNRHYQGLCGIMA